MPCVPVRSVVTPLFCLLGLLILACGTEPASVAPSGAGYDVLDQGRSPRPFLVSVGCTPLGPGGTAARLVLVSTPGGPLERFDCGTLSRDSVRLAVEQYWALLPTGAHAQTEAEEHLTGEALDWWEAMTPYGSPSADDHYLWIEIQRHCCTGLSGVPHGGDGFFLDISAAGPQRQEEELTVRVNGDEVWFFTKAYEQFPDVNDSYWTCQGQTNCVPADSSGGGGGGEPPALPPECGAEDDLNVVMALESGSQTYECTVTTEMESECPECAGKGAWAYAAFAVLKGGCAAVPNQNAHCMGWFRKLMGGDTSLVTLTNTEWNDIKSRIPPPGGDGKLQVVDSFPNRTFLSVQYPKERVYKSFGTPWLGSLGTFSVFFNSSDQPVAMHDRYDWNAGARGALVEVAVSIVRKGTSNTGFEIIKVVQ